MRVVVASQIMTDPQVMTDPRIIIRASAYETRNAGRRIDERAVEVLRSWIGQREVGANNSGSFVMGLTHGFVGAWCSALQRAADEEAALLEGLRVPMPWQRKWHSAQRYTKEVARLGRAVELEELRKGDRVCLARGLWYQGHSIRIADGAWPHVSIVDGNVGSFKRTQGRVREVEMDLRESKVLFTGRLG